MSDQSATPTYLVDTSSDPILIRIQGRATYLNCAPFGELLDELIAGSPTAIKIDFELCTGLDSTVLGLIAGAAMRFQKRTPPGRIIARKLSPRNLEIIRNLGIERFLTIVEPTGQTAPPFFIREIAPPSPADRQAMIKAHEQLIAADPSNASRFQDVVDYLRQKHKSQS